MLVHILEHRGFSMSSIQKSFILIYIYCFTNVVVPKLIVEVEGKEDWVEASLVTLPSNSSDYSTHRHCGGAKLRCRVKNKGDRIISNGCIFR